MIEITEGLTIDQKKKSKGEADQDKWEGIIREKGKEKEKKVNREKKKGKDSNYDKDKRIKKEDDKKANNSQKERIEMFKREKEVHLHISVVPLHLPVQAIPQHEILLVCKT